MERFDLGNHSLRIATTSPEAQKFFNLGLNWTIGFNQEEGTKCFLKALEHDPTCAMAHWGVAYASGPFYNMPWREFSPNEAAECTEWCHSHLKKAADLVTKDHERAVIEAAQKRVQKPHPVSQAEFDQWDDDYADALRQVYKQYPESLDVIALFVEALMSRTPWQLWDVKKRLPAEGADTLEALKACEEAIAMADSTGQLQHPAILHLHIHLLEMSPYPERALRSCAELGDLMHDAGHLNHMPAHIYVQCGMYDRAKTAGEKAIACDNKYIDYTGNLGFYAWACSHDLHLQAVACCFLGQYEPALEAALAIRNMLVPERLDFSKKPYLSNALDGYYAMRVHVLVRFGRWQELTELQLDFDASLYPISTAMTHYGRALGNATLKDFDTAAAEIAAFEAQVARISPDQQLHNNLALTVLDVGRDMLMGEYEYHRGNPEKGFEHLRSSVAKCDALNYSEPWAWMHPPRHALGALLSEQGQFEEAEAVYRADLGLDETIQRCSQNRQNVWALHGLVECLRRRDAQSELDLYLPALNRAAAKTDVAISSSCCCRAMQNARKT